MNDFANESIPDERGEMGATPINDESTFSSYQDTPTSSPLPPMRNVKDLVTVLGQMHKKITALEAENAALKDELKNAATKRDVVQMIAKVETLNLPRHGLFSDSFIVRSVSIYGHWFVANLVVSIVFSLLWFLLFFAFWEQLYANLANSGAF
jgi:hypothetical protein